MRLISVCCGLIVAILALSCTPTSGNHVTAGSSEISYKQNAELLRREKRQLEDFENENEPFAKQAEPEEPGFWDRIVRVAIKMFSRFVEWLNSS